MWVSDEKKKKKEEAKTLTTKRETKANIKESKCREMSVNKGGEIINKQGEHHVEF
jgi:hypothetical protein